MDFLDEIIGLIDDSIKEDAQNLITEGNIIKDGFNKKIDASRTIVREAHDFISKYQLSLQEETGISKLRIKFTNNIGYFIEIPKSQHENIPEYFKLKQSLAQVVRYTSDDLQDFEQSLSLADSHLFEEEYKVFLNIRNNVMGHFGNIYTLSRKIASLDFLVNGAYISSERRYEQACVSSSYNISIIGGMHPVISCKMKEFINNDMCLSAKDFIHIITGPNMGGKSTYLRQNALLILMVHMGYDIPCTSAKISVVDKIFSRVGAGDNLYLGQSTFMVEMQEISYILRNSTEKSFVIIDEIGRGTSTYDGMSLAGAVLRHNQAFIKAKTLFATHYHEIIDHANSLTGVTNYSVAVGENDDNIIFLRKIIPGGMRKSYGIEVAKLAGIPEEVLDYARLLMKKMQSLQENKQLSLGLSYTLENKDKELVDNYKKCISDLKNINIDKMSPLESLQYLSQVQEQLKKAK